MENKLELELELELDISLAYFDVNDSSCHGRITLNQFHILFVCVFVCYAYVPARSDGLLGRSIRLACFMAASLVHVCLFVCLLRTCKIGWFY